MHFCRFTPLLALVFALFAFTANAQMAGNAVRGAVVDKDGMAVAFANVFVPEINWGTTTDMGGYFSLRGLEPGGYTVKVSAIGYEVGTSSFVIGEKDVLKLDFVLQETSYGVPQVEVIGMHNRTMKKLPGSAARIDAKEIEWVAPVSGNEVFRRVPGIHVVDEEGAGLRTNIGIRGLDPDRSRTVLVLEDGIPVALNPYGEPEMYFTPSMDRMAGVEVIKGAGQIVHGPRTIGGVVNYLTPDAPENEEIKVRLNGGQGGYFSGLVSYGNTTGNTGIYVSYLRKQADDIAGTNFRLNDVTAKVSQKLSDRSSLRLKIGLYNETSNSTYIGLTQTMWDAGGQDFVRMAPDDVLNVSRYSVSATHAVRFNPKTSLQSTVFAYTTTRDWRRQDFSTNGNRNDLTGVVWGDPSVENGAVFMRTSTGNRDRSFNVAGVQSNLSHKYQLGGLRSEVLTGVRAQFEEADEQRINGSFPTAVSGALVEDELRTGRALSAFAENKIWLTEKLVFSAGLRAEYYEFEREIFRRASKDTLIEGSSKVAQLIPGAGFNYNFNKNVQVFGGAHRGFAPPGLKDAITAAGVAYELDAELSWNFELGFRSLLARGVQVEMTGFMMDFDNQIIPVSESSGGAGSGLVNGGRTMHRGVEAAVIFSIGEVADLPFRLDFDVNATYVDAFLTGDRFASVDDVSVSIDGNRTPYAPEFFLSSALTFEMKNGFGMRVGGTYVGEQYTDLLNTVAPTPDGQNGLLPSYFVLDGSVRYSLRKWNTTFNISCKNMLDERYIASRRPQGIRAGIPRFLTAGVSVVF